jgi:hypothetical protein
MTKAECQKYVSLAEAEMQGLTYVFLVSLRQDGMEDL